MEFNFLFSRSWIVWNSELQYGKVWIFGSFVEIFWAMLNFCMPVYFSCNLMKSLSEFCWNWWNWILKSKVFPKTNGYIAVFSFSNPVYCTMFTICISNANFGMEFYIFGIKKYGKVWNLMCLLELVKPLVTNINSDMGNESYQKWYI